MDAKVHRAMLKIAAEQAMKRIKSEGKRPSVDLQNAFWAIHQGNWLTDMNQATCFFDLLEKRGDPYSVLDLSKRRYNLPSTVTKNETKWTNMFRELWAHECQDARLEPFLPRDAGKDAPLNPQIIGGYYPMDHFDVVDPTNDRGETVSREDREFETAATQKMTLTAHHGIFHYALDFWLRPQFMKHGQDRTSPDALRSIGHAAHILQDFFGHSNFVELLLMIAATRSDVLHDDLVSALGRERSGTFGSFWQKDANQPSATPVMTGRFDRIDTIAAILGIYRNGLVRPWSDLGAGGLGGVHGDTNDLIFDVMFGTFSDRPYASGARSVVRTLLNADTAMEGVKEAVRKGALSLFAEIAERFASAETKASIEEVKSLIASANVNVVKRYATVGRILCLEHVIERDLREQIRDAGRPKLPHHTLLAKDRDVSHPEVRLAYKLACLLATEVTTELLYHYAVGSSLDAVESLLHRYFRHPADYLEEPSIRAALRERTDRLYGGRWWLAAATDEVLVGPRCTTQ